MSLLASSKNEYIARLLVFPVYITVAGTEILPLFIYSVPQRIDNACYLESTFYVTVIRNIGEYRFGVRYLQVLCFACNFQQIHISVAVVSTNKFLLYRIFFHVIRKCLAVSYLHCTAYCSFSFPFLLESLP